MIFIDCIVKDIKIYDYFPTTELAYNRAESLSGVTQVGTNYGRYHKQSLCILDLLNCTNCLNVNTQYFPIHLHSTSPLKYWLVLQLLEYSLIGSLKIAGV